MPGPDFTTETFHSALGLHHAGRLTEAEAAYRRVLAADPGHFEALHYLGVLRAQCGDMAQAAELIGAAVKIDAGVPVAHYHLAGAFVGLGRRQEALASYDRAVELKPDFAQAHGERADILLEISRNKEALEAYDRAIALQPALVEAHDGRGRALAGLGRGDEALAAFERAIVLKPDFAEAHNNRGMALVVFGRKEEAMAAFERASALRPDFVEAHNNRGTTLLDLGRNEAALDEFQRALALKHDFAPTYYNLGNTLLALGKMEAALAAFDSAVTLRPDDADAASAGFTTAAQLCSWRGRANALKRHCEEGNPSAPYAMLFALDDPECQLLAARARAAAQPSAALAASGATVVHSRLRVAYLSPDFHNHPVAYQAVELFERHDRARFETYGICLRSSPDIAIRQRLRRAFEHFVEAGARSAREITQLLADSQIDIAVDLSGFTEAGGVSSGRLVFAERMEERARHLARLALADLFLDTLPYNAHATASDNVVGGRPGSDLHGPELCRAGRRQPAGRHRPGRAEWRKPGGL